MKPNKAALKRISQEYEGRARQWQRDQDAYVLEHGQKAWDAKVDREIAELYDTPEPFPMPGEKQ